jgi:RimJ/RimL family protein N-acetyltransferase
MVLEHDMDLWRRIKASRKEQAERGVHLRDAIESDLPVFFEQQLNPTANHMAAFTSKDPADRAAFDKQWGKMLEDEDLIIKTVLFDGQVAGHIVQYLHDGNPEIGYWFGKAFWGQGIATEALQLFLAQVEVRPLGARAAKDNAASVRVLEKCGFVVVGENKGFANARGAETEEYIFKLE